MVAGRELRVIKHIFPFKSRGWNQPVRGPKRLECSLCLKEPQTLFPAPQNPLVLGGIPKREGVEGGERGDGGGGAGGRVKGENRQNNFFTFYLLNYIVASHKASQVTGKDLLEGWVKSKKKITAVQKPTAFFSRNCLSIISVNVSRS